MILAVRSDKLEAEIYLLNDDGTLLRQKIWDAGRTLAKNLLGELDELVNGDFDQLTGLIAYKGPGSFTGLRIGITTQNAIAYGKELPIVGTAGDNWLSALKRCIKTSKKLTISRTKLEEFANRRERS